jgi:hypothetical protein
MKTKLVLLPSLPGHCLWISSRKRPWEEEMRLALLFLLSLYDALLQRGQQQQQDEEDEDEDEDEEEQQ